MIELAGAGEAGDLLNFGTTLAEAKQPLARVQQAIVTAQAQGHAVRRPDCSSCGGRGYVKDWRHHRIATLFGVVTLRLPRIHCVLIPPLSG